MGCSGCGCLSGVPWGEDQESFPGLPPACWRRTRSVLERPPLYECGRFLDSPTAPTLSGVTGGARRFWLADDSAEPGEPEVSAEDSRE